MELLVSCIALFSVLTLTERDVLLHDEVVLAANTTAPELQQNIQPVLLHEMAASLSLIARNAVLQLPLVDPSSHGQLLELPGQLQGRHLPRQQQHLPQGRQLLQQSDYCFQVCLVFRVHILLEPCFHVITYPADLLPTMEALDKIWRKLPVQNLIELLDTEAINAES